MYYNPGNLNKHAFTKVGTDYIFTMRAYQYDSILDFIGLSQHQLVSITKNVENIFQIISAFSFSKRNVNYSSTSANDDKYYEYVGNFKKQCRNLQQEWYGLVLYK